MMSKQRLRQILNAVLKGVHTVHNRQINPLQPITARPFLTRHQSSNIIDFVHWTIWIHLNDVRVHMMTHHVLMQPVHTITVFLTTSLVWCSLALMPNMRPKNNGFKNGEKFLCVMDSGKVIHRNRCKLQNCKQIRTDSTWRFYPKTDRLSVSTVRTLCDHQWSTYQASNEHPQVKSRQIRPIYFQI